MMLVRLELTTATATCHATADGTGFIPSLAAAEGRAGQGTGPGHVESALTVPSESKKLHEEHTESNRQR